MIEAASPASFCDWAKRCSSLLLQSAYRRIEMGKRSSFLKGQLRYQIPNIKLCIVQDGPPIKQLYAAKFFSPLTLASEEHFVSLHLNARHEVIGLHEVSHGTVSSSLVHPREVFKAAMLSNSHAIIVCHNHPSGARLNASQDDLKTTEQLVKGANLLGISLLDHLIVGRSEDAYSIRENYPALWSECA
jgi:hypothetical protein